jgi:Icc protein
MIIAQIFDTHTSDADQRIRDFALTVADINALDPAPDVIADTGYTTDGKTNTARQ